MSPRQRSLVSLAVIAVACIATYLALQLAPLPEPPPSADLKRVFDFTVNDVRALTVESWQGRLLARRTGEGWLVEKVVLRGQGTTADAEPMSTPTPAEVQEALDTLVSDLVATPEIDRFPPDGVALSQFGLEHPQASVTLELDSGPPRKLELGDLTVTTSALYARALPSQDVLQVGTLVFNNVAAALYRLRALASPAE